MSYIKKVDGVDVPMTLEEIAQRQAEEADWEIKREQVITKAFLAEDDIKNMPRMIEDLMVAIASGTPLTRDSFPPPVWNKINARRNKRGQAPV